MPEDSQAFVTEWKGKSIDGTFCSMLDIHLLTYSIQPLSNKLEREQLYEYDS